MGGAGVVHSVDIVNFAMVRGTGSKTGFFDSMLGMIGHRVVVSGKNGGLVHVIPKPSDTLRQEVFVQRAPPLPAAWPSELRENRRSRPDRPDERRAIRILDELIFGKPRVIGLVSSAR